MYNNNNNNKIMYRYVNSIISRTVNGIFASITVRISGAFRIMIFLSSKEGKVVGYKRAKTK